MTLASIPKLTLEIVGKGRPPQRRTLTAARTIIGRESGDLVLDDSETSALHAEIDCSQGHVIVRDLGSRNGTWREGERLPQFALYEGQSFICGTTEIRLVAIEGAPDRPQAGRTAVGQTKDVLTAEQPEGSSATMLRGSGPLPPTSHKTLLGTPSAASAPAEVPPGWQVPGESVPSVGHPAPLSRPTLNAPDRESPVPPSSTSTIPGEDQAQEPVVTAGSTQVAMSGGTQVAPVPEPAPHDLGAPGRTDLAAAPTSNDFRGPVPNAVIKDANAPAAPSARSAPKRGGAGKTIVKIGLVLVAVAAIAGLAYLVYTLVAGRSIAFTEKLAAELPQDAIGVYAISSPKEMVELFGDEVPDDVRAQATERLDFDPFDLEAWEDLGIDPDEPVGASLLSLEHPIVAISVGVADRDRITSSLKTVLPQTLGADELAWVDREYGDTPGLWLEEPMPAAALFRDDRMILVVPVDGPVDAQLIERTAESMAALAPGTTLADRPGFAGIVRPTGKVVTMMYVDGASLRAAIPGAGLFEMALRTALADIDGFQGALSHKGSEIYFTYAAIMRDGSRALEVVAGTKRTTEALDRIPAPVMIEADVAFEAEAVDRSLGSFASLTGQSLTFLESELREDAGIDLRNDVTKNLSGKLGWALLHLPSERGKQDFGMVAWAGVKAEGDARSAAERLYAKAHDAIGMQLEQVQGVTVYKIEESAEDEFRDPTVRAWVHEGHLWLAIGEVDVAPIIAGPDKAFHKDVRHDAIAAAVKKGSYGAGFVDIKGFVDAIRPLLREGDREDLDSLAPILSLLEVASVRVEREGRAVVARATVHTTADQGLPTLVRETTRLLGAKFAEQLARAAREEKCNKLAEHVVGLTRAALSEAGADLDTAWEIERDVLEKCAAPQMTDAHLDCYLATETIGGLVECDKANASGDDDGGDGDAGDGGDEGDGGAEPRPVPYVDDIWPHLSDDPDSEHPQPEVNYAVPLGPDPQARGAENALVTIVEFGDFQCPYCKRVAPTLDEVLADHGKDVRVVWRQHPLENLHSKARIASKAAIAAGKQGKFWEMHEKLFANQHVLSEENFRAWAEQLGLDITQYDRDYYDAETDRQLQRDIEAAEKFGAAGTPAFFVNGRYLGGAQTKAAFDAMIKEEKERALKFVERRGNTRKRLYEDMISHFAPEVIKPRSEVRPIDPEAKRYLLSTTGVPQKGSTSARVSIIECGDFDCPYCARVRTTIDEVLAAYPSQVSFYFVHSPLSFHRGAEPAARAAVAADNQGKFWEMHDALFEGQTSSTRTEADFVGYAKSLKLDVAKFKEDLAAAETASRVEEQRKMCADNDATATPTFFINGARVEGAQEFERFKQLIDTELASGI